MGLLLYDALDYYLDGSGPDPPAAAFVQIYAVNEAAFQAELAAPIPKPGTLLLLGSGISALALWQRRRS